MDVLDWTKLPTELHYLIEPAERYGGIQFELRIYDFLQHEMTPTEKLALQALSECYVRDCDTINAWLDRFPITEHPEARLVYFTGHLIGLGVDNGWL